MNILLVADWPNTGHGETTQFFNCLAKVAKSLGEYYISACSVNIIYCMPG